MKKIGIIALTMITLVSCGGEKTLEDLETEKKALISAQKEVIRQQKKELHSLDSILSNHPDFGTQTSKIKTVPVTVDTAEVVTFEHFFEVHGNVEVEENAALFPEAPGNVKTIHVKEGQTVKKGDLIITLDASTLESGIKELKSSYTLVKVMFEKQSALWNQKIGSEVQYLETKTNKESLEQKLKTMHEQLDMYKIRAPFAGIVDEIKPRVGESAVPGYPLARVINLDKVYLEADVSEKYISTVKTGGFVEVKLPSHGETVNARVTRSGNFINPANRTFKVRVEFANPNGKYKPNQLAVLKIRDYKADSAVVIPSRVIQQDRSGQDYVYTFIKENEATRVKKLKLEVGVSYDGQSEILSGITADAVFIDKGAKSVQAGDAIEIK
jgi:membrane fusion protein (multidrug efflux system)